MKHSDTDYLTMVSVTDRTLVTNEAAWKDSPPAVRQITAIRTLYTDLNAAQRGATTESSGITADKETAVQAAISKAVILSKAVRSYALEKKNMGLHNQFKVSDTSLNRLSDEELVQYLEDMLQRIKDIGAPLEEFEMTPAKLQAFETAIREADSRKSDTRLAITGRKGHNQTIPQKMTAMRQAFAILDNLIASWEEDKPAFVRNYFNARQVIDTSGKGAAIKTTIKTT